MTTVDSAVRSSSSLPTKNRPIEIYVSIVINILIAIACVLGALTIIQLLNVNDPEAIQDSIAQQQLVRLGDPVIIAVTGILLLPALVAIFSTIQLLRDANPGRYAALSLQFLGLVFSLIALVQFWGFFDSFELITDRIMENPWLLAGIPLAYIVFWLGGRFSDRSPVRGWLETAGALIGMATLITILVLSNFLTFANNILSSYANPGTWIATILVVIFAYIGWRMLMLGRYFNETQEEMAAWQGWLMLSPNIVGFMIFFAGPLLLSFYLSFTDSTVGAVPNVVGLENYGRILSLEFKTLEDATATAQSALSFGYEPLGEIQMGASRLVIGALDRLFWISLRNTFLFCLLLVPLSVLPALGLSLVLNSKLPGVNFFRAVYFLPSVAAVVGTALIWRWLYNSENGYINYAITQLINWLNGLGFQLSDPAIAWLTGPSVVLISMVLLAAWQSIGFNTVLFLAGLQGISKELYEASSIDGANRLETFLYITVPMLAPTTFFVIITTMITGLQVFNEPYALFVARPIPENATTSVFYLYNQGFVRFEFGYASAIAWILFAVIFMMTLIQFRLQRSNAYEG
jgi:ABC-type sugar transport system permease subunit